MHFLISLECREAGRRREDSSARVQVCVFTLSTVCQSGFKSVQHDSRTAAHPALARSADVSGMSMQRRHILRLVILVPGALGLLALSLCWISRI